MRILRMILCDIRYQIKYGFYFLYGVISLLYIGILFLLPETFLRPVTALIIFSDPSALGFFFIGGMILLERGEGLHTYYAILPSTVREYIISKIVSLSLLSSFVALLIAGVVLDGEVNFFRLFVGVFAGASIFSLFGLVVGSLSKSLNHYFVMSVPVGLLLMAPALLIYFDVSLFFIEVLPATLLLRVLHASIGLEIPYSSSLSLLGLMLWCIPSFILANNRCKIYMERAGG